jgi:mono/diheme cytochrome c family protein
VSKRFLVFLIVCLFTLASCQPQLDREAMMADGEAIYITSCARCHQDDGSGYEEFPPLAGNPVVTLHQPAQMIDIVMDGRGSMPAFRGSLSEQEAAAVLTYIRNAWGNEASIIAPKQTR